jgi:putative transposase
VPDAVVVQQLPAGARQDEAAVLEHPGVRRDVERHRDVPLDEADRQRPAVQDVDRVQHLVWLKISAVLTSLRLLGLGVYWTEQSRHDSSLRNGYDLPRPARHGRWLQRHQQQVITYLLAENRVLKAQLGGRWLRLTDTNRRRLAALAHPLGRTRLQQIATSTTPDTLLRWYHRLIAQKFDGSKRRTPLGRPPVAEEVEWLAVQMAEENWTWGYRSLQGALANLGHHIDAITVRNILCRHRMNPAPQRRKAGMSWQQFLKLHWDVLAATDFFAVEVAAWHGLVTYYVLVVMELSTRRVQVAGITPHPTDAFMTQCARQLKDPIGGFLLGKRYLMHDRDTKYTWAFDTLLKDSGVEPIVLPPRSPNLNACCERFVRSIAEEALNQMIVIGEATLRYAIRSYLIHYHHERNHQGLGKQLIVSEPAMGSRCGAVIRRERLGGLLSYYHREAA